MGQSTTIGQGTSKSVIRRDATRQVDKAMIEVLLLEIDYLRDALAQARAQNTALLKEYTELRERTEDETDEA